MNDKTFLKWIHGRLENFHDENPRLDYMLRLKQIINDMPGETTAVIKPEGVIVMDRELAIGWIRNKYQGYWPNDVHNSPVPEGWKWVVRRKPYQINNEYLLQSSEYGDVTQEDVYK